MGDFSILAYRIKNLRLSLGMTQREFAKEAGCTAATLSAYENGSKSPSLEIVKGIAEAFGVSIDWLCGLADRPNGTNTPKTYADIIFMLSEIDKSIELCLKEKSDFTDKSGFQQRGCAIHFVGYEINKFLSDWAKYRTLRNQNTIDADIYHACMNKLYDESNVQILNTPKEN